MLMESLMASQSELWLAELKGQMSAFWRVALKLVHWMPAIESVTWCTCRRSLDTSLGDPLVRLGCTQRGRGELCSQSAANLSTKTQTCLGKRDRQHTVLARMTVPLMLAGQLMATGTVPMLMVGQLWAEMTVPMMMGGQLLVLWCWCWGCLARPHRTTHKPRGTNLAVTAAPQQCIQRF